MCPSCTALFEFGIGQRLVEKLGQCSKKIFGEEIAMLRPWMGKLYVQVLIGIFIGLLLGLLTPDIAVTLQPLADGFIKLIKMLLAPIIFGTVVLGMAKMGNITEVGSIGVRALIYFEVVSTIALVIGLQSSMSWSPAWE